MRKEKEIHCTLYKPIASPQANLFSVEFANFRFFFSYSISFRTATETMVSHALVHEHFFGGVCLHVLYTSFREKKAHLSTHFSLLLRKTEHKRINSQDQWRPWSHLSTSEIVAGYCTCSQRAGLVKSTKLHRSFLWKDRSFLVGVNFRVLFNIRGKLVWMGGQW